MSRAPVDEVPEVSRNPLGTVVVEMTGPHAVALGQILFHYGALLTLPHIQPMTSYDPEVWQHTLVRLFAESAQLRGPAELVDVDAQDVSLRRRLCPEPTP